VFRLKLPSRPPAGERFLTPAEFAALTEEFWDAFGVAAIALMAGCGLRWGEATGLHRHRMDRERGWLRVVETWDPKAGQIKAYPKGKKARDVPVPTWVGEILDRLPILPAADCAHVHAAGRCRSNLVLHGAGQMTDVNNWRKRVWAPALGRAKIGHARPRDLRHTYASWLVQNGVSIEEVPRLLGQASSVVTQRYAHLADTRKDSVLTALGDPFGGANVGQTDTPADSQSIQAVPA
jgi:integrase